MKAEYKGKTYDIMTVNFEEQLVGLYDSSINTEEDMEDDTCELLEDIREDDIQDLDPDIIWARCENCRIINESEVEQKNEK